MLRREGSESRGTYDVRDWLESLGFVNACFSGRIDNELEKVLCVYDDRMDDNSKDICYGGDSYTTKTFMASVVLQWNKDPEETEKAAKAFINKLKEIEVNGSFEMGDYFVNFISVMDRSKDLYRNENGLCQRRINFDIIYS